VLDRDQAGHGFQQLGHSAAAVDGQVGAADCALAGRIGLAIIASPRAKTTTSSSTSPATAGVQASKRRHASEQVSDWTSLGELYSPRARQPVFTR
jgi:hypothetical protein